MSHSNKHVLIVEDNEKNRKLFKLLVKSMGYECLVATDGTSGVAIALEKLPDLILMDIQMPSLDGISALKLLQDNHKTKSIPVVAVTSYAMDHDRARLLEAGFTDYLAKPIDINLFREAVQKILEP